MPDNKKQGRSNKTMTFFVCFLAALAGLLFGLDIGVIAGALPFIANEFQISAHTQEWVVSSMMFGAAVGAVGSGWLSSNWAGKEPDDRRNPLRRRFAVLCRRAKRRDPAGFPCAAGLAVGVASYTAPLYLSEIAQKKFAAV